MNKSVVVAGGGDSANVINEFLMRIGPDGAYKFDSAQVGNVGKVYWLGVSFEDCRTFIDQARGRYALLESALNSGRIVPVPAKIDSIQRVGGEATKFRVQSGIRSGSGLKPATTDEGTIFSGGADAVVGADLNVDYVLLATGFRSDASKVFERLIGPVTPEAYAAKLKKIEAAVPGFNGDESAPVIDIATQLDNERIYFIGPANEVVGGLPRPDELARVNANTVSFFANVARTRQLARMLDVESRLGSLDELYGFANKVPLERARVPGDGASSLRLPTASIPVLPATAKLEVGSEIAKVLGQFDLPGDLQLTMTFTRAAGSGADSGISVAVPSLSEGSQTALVQSINEQPRLVELLFGYLGPQSRVKQVEIAGTTNAAGTFGWDIDVLPRVNVRE